MLNKKSKTIFAIVIVAAFFCLADFVSAGSLWAKRTKFSKDMYSDDVARKIGDILTITIKEQSDVTNTAKREMSKETTRNNQFNGEIGVPKLFESLPTMNFGAGNTHTNDFASETKNNDSRLFEDNITVVVMDIMPNGNLVVNGTLSRSISGEIQNIEVSGIVRPSDIAYDNTVDSKRVAAFKIITKEDGISAPYNRPGWLGSILDKFWPF